MVVLKTLIGVLLGSIILASLSGQEQPPPGFAAVLPDEIKWKSQAALPGVQVAILLGDPDKPVPIVIRVKLPANAKVMPHTHPDARTYTVLAGEWKLGFGEKFEAAKLRTFPADSVYRLPAGVPHFQATGNRGALIQIESTGPTRTDFLKPADDPRKE